MMKEINSTIDYDVVEEANVPEGDWIHRSDAGVPWGKYWSL